ncbi:PAS-domain containing protein [Roseivivax isoporae]|uniref:PAS domain-containing protein n=1 Tax=Roseivivax isoporae LMG 25204 TaxID=1449351 RepID=X7F753_9RHOB|nr:PAS-domain containing protein [Roseivivax isoporae]ETX27914.1 hypothetical protein RISW2_10620 [Roseivivax isoporae LMG 25204]
MGPGYSLGGVAAALGLGTLAAWLRRDGTALSGDGGTEAPLYLLRGGRMFDACEAGETLIDCLFPPPRPDGTDIGWEAVAGRLRTLYPSLPAAGDAAPGRHAAADADLPDLVLACAGPSLRVSLAGPGAEAALRVALALRTRAVDRLAGLLADAPCPVWETDAAGRVTYANARYQALARAAGDAAPLPVDLTPGSDSESHRAEAPAGAAGDRWFEVVSRRNGEGARHYAIGIDAVVRAEAAQRNFVQTLSKTFSYLPTGLAIFDRNQRLVLFNPALVDLTGLPPERLSTRPNLMTFFDLLREKRVMPEPRDYGTWRADLSRLVAAARDDRYSETWPLSNGLTYRLTGRPHPDGAVAFLLEDISDEVTLSRRFRNELELGQSVIDAFDDAVAVFTATGALALCNAGYRRLWDTDPEALVADATIVDATRHWQHMCRPTPVWGELRDYVTGFGERAGWDADVALADGTPVHCRIEPIHAGATLVRFVPDWQGVQRQERGVRRA